MEMNTRIQVEHPVTEQVFGVDLVREQIRVAQGEKLGYIQEDIKPNGHAIECRINAEDPETFIPFPGTVKYYHAPGGLGVRVDSGLYSGYKIPSCYDSMIAKIIVFAPTRKDAIIRMHHSLNEFVIDNAHNIGRWAALDMNSVSEEARKLKKESLSSPETVYYLPREDANDYYIKNGNTLLFATDRIMTIDGVTTFSQPISDIWDDVLPNDLHNEGNVEFKKGKKPEKLISRILELCTNEGDLVLDFFAGSGTTGAVAMKMNRKFILCEQMDYIQDITCQRLIQTIMHDSRGISSEVNWQGGGSFVYCELANANQNFVDEIQSASSLYEIKDIYLRIIETGFISSKVNPRNINDNVEDFYALSLEDQKCFLMELLDKNLLYVNYCDIDDEEYAISDEDKEFTRNFYGEV